jgi:predicted DNA-binding protein
VKEKRPSLVTFSVRLERETAERLRKVADSEHRTVAAELRRLIEAHIEKHPDGR